MIELGKYQILEITKKTDFGFYLKEPGSDGKQTILLPLREAPQDVKTGDSVNVFLYRDSEDREIATSVKVPITLGDIAVLRVKEVNQNGAFLDWGLLKDLMLPYKEQTKKVEEGDQVLVTLYLDKSNRLCASMKVYDLLSKNSPYKKDDMVTGIVYETLDNFGVFVAVDNKYSAMIPKNELFKPVQIGEIINARILNIREDGKITLSLREKSYVQMDTDTMLILEKLQAAGGFLPLNDNTSPDKIKDVLHISKNAFKRAIGRLLKAGTINITDEGIRLIKDLPK